MASITLKGNPVHTRGELPSVGSTLPDFTLTTGALEDVNLATYKGKTKVLNIVPSLDTGICAASAKRFEAEAANLPGVVILTISADLPFAQKRFCSAEGIEQVVTLSQMRDRTFGQDYGIEMTSGPMAGVMGRAVVIADAEDKVLYTELVPEIAQEPNYEAALAALKKAE